MNFDLPVSLGLQEIFSGSFLDPVMIFITRLGNFGFIWITFCLLLLLIKKSRGIGLACSFSILIDIYLPILLRLWLKELDLFRFMRLLY